MTLLEKIKRLKWFDSISKLRDILEELYNSSSGGSGGNQDLQSVLDNGGVADGSITMVFDDGTNQAYINSNVLIVSTDNENTYTSLKLGNTSEQGLGNYAALNLGRNGKESSILANPNSTAPNSRFFLPARDILEDNYKTLATTDDIKLKEYTVATLPTGTKGDVAFVNDASSPIFLAPVSGGGSVVVRVFHNGTTWIVQ